MRLKVRESDIQKAILEYLKLRGYVCRRSNAGKMFIKDKGRTRAINIGEAGWPDIDGITKSGIFFGIEVKVPGGQPTPIQAQKGEEINKSNGIWFVATDVAEVIARGF